MARRSYTLLGGKLEPHVGHKVEVTGTPEEMTHADAMQHQDATASHAISHGHATGRAEDHVHPVSRRQLLLALARLRAARNAVRPDNIANPYDKMECVL